MTAHAALLRRVLVLIVDMTLHAIDFEVAFIERPGSSEAVNALYAVGADAL